MTSPPSVQQEPSGWELKRAVERLETALNGLGVRIEARLDKLVTQEAFAAEQRRVDEKLKDLADDLAQERVARAEVVAREEAERIKGDGMQQAALDKLIRLQQWLLVAIVLPVAFFAIDIWLRYGGGGR